MLLLPLDLVSKYKIIIVQYNRTLVSLTISVMIIKVMATTMN